MSETTVSRVFASGDVRPEVGTGLKLDLGCGQNLREGYTGVDYLPLDHVFPNGAPEHYDDQYMKVDLFRFPWPFEDNSVSSVHSSHFVEHIPHYRPWFNEVDGWWLFFKELHRVMEPNAIALIGHPFSRSDRAFWDPTHERFIHVFTWFYLDREWRESDHKGCAHYAPFEVNFKVESIDVYGVPPSLEGKSENAMAFAQEHYFNPWDDLAVELRCIK